MNSFRMVAREKTMDCVSITMPLFTRTLNSDAPSHRRRLLDCGQPRLWVDSGLHTRGLLGPMIPAGTGAFKWHPPSFGSCV
jgi:hypothetical protein